MKMLHDTDQCSLSTNESFENAAKVLEVGHLVFFRLCQRVFSTEKRNNPKRNSKNRPLLFMKLSNQKLVIGTFLKRLGAQPFFRPRLVSLTLKIDRRLREGMGSPLFFSFIYTCSVEHLKLYF